MEIKDRKIPVSITLTLRHIELMEKAIEKSGEDYNYSKYIRGLIEKQNPITVVDEAEFINFSLSGNGMKPPVIIKESHEAD